jgi:hypothetical protein
MACDITQGRVRPCKQSLGGVGRFFVYNYIPDPFTIASGVATAINPDLTEVFEFEIEGDGNNVVESIVSDRNTGTSVNTQTITINLKKIDATTSLQLNLLTHGFAPAVVKDRNGVFHALGIDDGIDWSVSQNTGGAKTEMNGYTLTGVSTTGALSPKLDSATITAFLALLP